MDTAAGAICCRVNGNEFILILSPSFSVLPFSFPVFHFLPHLPPSPLSLTFPFLTSLLPSSPSLSSSSLSFFNPQGSDYTPAVQSSRDSPLSSVSHNLLQNQCNSQQYNTGGLFLQVPGQPDTGSRRSSSGVNLPQLLPAAQSLSSGYPHSAMSDMPAHDLGHSEQQQQQQAGMAFTHPLSLSQLPQLPQPDPHQAHNAAPPPGVPESLGNAGTATWAGSSGGGGGGTHQGEASTQSGLQQQLQQPVSWDAPMSSKDHPQAGVASDLATSQQQQQQQQHEAAAFSSTTSLHGYGTTHQEIPPQSESTTSLTTFPSTYQPSASTYQQQLQPPPPPSSIYQPLLPQESPFSFPTTGQEDAETPTDQNIPKGTSKSL